MNIFELAQQSQLSMATPSKSTTLKLEGNLIRVYPKSNSLKFGEEFARTHNLHAEFGFELMKSSFELADSMGIDRPEQNSTGLVKMPMTYKPSPNVGSSRALIRKNTNQKYSTELAATSKVAVPLETILNDTDDGLAEIVNKGFISYLMEIYPELQNTSSFDIVLGQSAQMEGVVTKKFTTAKDENGNKVVKEKEEYRLKVELFEISFENIKKEATAQDVKSADNTDLVVNAEDHITNETATDGATLEDLPFGDENNVQAETPQVHEETPTNESEENETSEEDEDDW